MKHKELLTWLVFIALVLIFIIPTELLFRFLNIEGTSALVLAFIVGMLLMFLSEIIINKFDK